VPEPEAGDPVLLEFVRELRAHSPGGDVRVSARMGGPSPQFAANAARMSGMAIQQAGVNAYMASRNVAHVATPILAAAGPIDNEA